ncbi:Aminotransferase-like, PLP-dependent enzyme [Sesbania bispinosa]|nr:Aminotransferase-like, PLP-dependent enzyme [Sesbania bispinosa]
MKAASNCNQSGHFDYPKTEISDVPLLSCSEAIEKLKSFREKHKGKQQYLAMYSSIFGGITTDPAAMVIPMDDHMVHRGHGVFDTTAIMDGGVKVVTSSVPIKPPQFATTKSVNYLPNVLAKMEAEEVGAFAGIWLDSDGFVAEGPSMNVAFVSKENELIMPQSDKILSGCTAKRVVVLAESLVREGKLQGIRMKNVTLEEGKKANEMMLLGSGILVRPVVQWDDQIIGDGKEGPVTQALLNLVVDDMKSALPTVGIPVPY